MARGGFSGAPAITADGIVLGIVAESLVKDNQPVELGYLSVMSVEGIYMCLSHNHIVPEHMDIQWDCFWNEESVMFSDDSFDHTDVTVYRGKNEFYFRIYSPRPDIIEKAIQLIERANNSYSPNWIHDKMVKVEFKDKSLTLEAANNLFEEIIAMIEESGIKRS